MAQPGTKYLWDPNKSNEENFRVMQLQGLGTTTGLFGQTPKFEPNTTVIRPDYYQQLSEEGRIIAEGRRATATPSVTQLAGYSGIPFNMETGTPETITRSGTPVKTPAVTEIGGQSLMDTQNSAQQRYLTEILGDINTRRTQTNRAYADLYNQAQMATRRRGGLSDVTGFTGGMQEQYQTKVSAAQEANLLNLGTQREMALRELDTEAGAAESNAMLMAQQEFEMMATQQDQYMGTALNYFTLAQQFLDAGDQEKADRLNAKAQEYLDMANQAGAQMGASTGITLPSLGGGDSKPITEPNLVIPKVDVNTEITSGTGITEQGKESVNSLATTLSNVAQSGGTAFGLDTDEIRSDSQVLSLLNARLGVGSKDDITLVRLTDGDLINAIREYEARTGDQVLKFDPALTAAAAIPAATTAGLAAGKAGGFVGGGIGGAAGSVVPVVGTAAGAAAGATAGAVSAAIPAVGLTVYNSAMYKITRQDAVKVLGSITTKYQNLQSGK